jgi:hypothetical protein
MIRKEYQRPLVKVEELKWQPLLVGSDDRRLGATMSDYEDEEW